MAIPQELVAALEDFQQEVRADVDPGKEDRQAADKQLRDLEGLEKKRATLEQSSSRLIEVIQEHLDRGDLSYDLDELIEFVDRHEREIKEAVEPALKRAHAGRSRIFSLPQSKRASALKLNSLFLATFTRALEQLRDLRWTLMAIRAEVEGPGDGPIFDDPDELERYLESV